MLFARHLPQARQRNLAGVLCFTDRPFANSRRVSSQDRESAGVNPRARHRHAGRNEAARDTSHIVLAKGGSAATHIKAPIQNSPRSRSAALLSVMFDDVFFGLVLGAEHIHPGMLLDRFENDFAADVEGGHGVADGCRLAAQ